MAVYIGLLRGVNVGGNTLKMERLREICEILGFGRVQTYLQSGNVIFTSKAAAKVIVQALEHKLQGESRLPVSVLVRTPAQLGKVLDRNPFGAEIGESRSKRRAGSEAGPVTHYVTFLSGSPTAESVKHLLSLKSGEDRVQIEGKEVFLHLAAGAAETKFNNVLIERLLGVRATTRNWNTVRSLHELASER